VSAEANVRRKLTMTVATQTEDGQQAIGIPPIRASYLILNQLDRCDVFNARLTGQKEIVPLQCRAEIPVHQHQ
jgi:hypothetical protein